METLRHNPYLGPRAFTREHRLYGRDRELRDLTSLLVSERIVLLYSPSGAGKSSLVQAALIPTLEARRFHVLPIVRVGLALPLARHPLLIAIWPLLPSRLEVIKRSSDRWPS